MKKLKIYIYIVAVGVLMAPGCTKNFEEINDNPDAITSVTPDLLLPGIIRTALNQMVNESWGIGNIVIQHTAKIQFVGEDRYIWGDRSGVWNSMYDNLRNVDQLLALSEKNNAPNYRGVALVMKAWMFSTITDAYGDVPFTEATKSLFGVLQPKYDSQESIYEGILADLRAANSSFALGAGTLVGDILYNGNIIKWKKLSNTLQLRYLMRIDHVHFMCTRCGITTCLQEVHIPEIKLPRGYKTRQTEVVVSGVCKECS